MQPLFWFSLKIPIFAPVTDTEVSPPMFDKSMKIEGYDDELYQAIQDEERRQEEHIELIASENYTSPRVMEAQGSVLTNKYAEGYPAKRYYGGCEYVDKAEQLASTGPGSCSAPTMPMCSRTPARRPMPRCTWPCASRAIPFSGCRWRMAGTSRTAPNQTFPARSTTRSSTAWIPIPARSITRRLRVSPVSTIRR